MPELPEVETVRRGLLSLVGQHLTQLTCHRPDLRHPLPLKALQTLVGQNLITLERRAKYLIWSFSNNISMIMHLGMSGHIILHPSLINTPPRKHDHVVMAWENRAQVVFNDPRRFGMIDVCPTDTLDQSSHLKNIGMEPLDKQFVEVYLADRLKNKKAPIKNILMDQRVVAGLGNIYCCEALFLAQIHPLQIGSSLTSNQIENLVIAIKKVLQKAIEAGGSSLRDYRTTSGELGYFQHHWSVYDQKGKACPMCQHPIEQLTMAGRSTYFCPNHQRIL